MQLILHSYTYIWCWLIISFYVFEDFPRANHCAKKYIDLCNASNNCTASTNINPCKPGHLKLKKIKYLWLNSNYRTYIEVCVLPTVKSTLTPADPKNEWCPRCPVLHASARLLHSHAHGFFYGVHPPHV